MGGGDLCEGEIGDLCKVVDGELAIARSLMPQLPSNFSMVYRCMGNVGDHHQHLPRRGHILVRQTSVTRCKEDVGDFCEVDICELATARSQTPQFPPD